MKDFALSPDGVPIYYDVQGDVPGQAEPALVFVHGCCCNRTHWRHQMEHFAPRHTVVAIDLGGHGESGTNRASWTMSTFGQDVATVIEKLNLAQVVLVGHSMGGTVIVDAARRIPDRVIGLVVADTFRDLGRTRTKDEIEAIVRPLRTDYIKTIRETVRSICLATSDPALIESLIADVAATSPTVGVEVRAALAGSQAEVRAGLSEITAPIYAINSDFRPTDIEVARRFGIEVKFMSGVGHFVMMEDPETFNRLLAETIQQIRASVLNSSTRKKFAKNL